MDILAQLKSAWNKLAFELGRLDAAITALSGSRRKAGRRRKMSAKSRAKIAVAQRARWAKWKAKRRKA